MNRRSRMAFALLCSLCAVQGSTAQAQWGYPGGFGGFGWQGWGVGTAEGDIARGMGAFAEGVGFYNKQTAIANSIDTDTVMRWNNYMHESQMQANRRHQQRLAESRDRNIRLTNEIQKRLRDNPEPRDIFQGTALNVALDEIDDPRVYTRALKGAKAKIGGERVRIIPFRYAAAALTLSIHQLATGEFPSALATPDFKDEREALTALDQQITKEVEEGEEPNPNTVKKLLGAIYSAEEKVAKVLAANSLGRKQAEKYLRALHGLVTMLKAPAVDSFVAGVEKRPDVSLGELLSFMTAFNLRFGVASTPQQREVYRFLYPKLVELRAQVAPALASTASPKLNGHEAENFFSEMNDDDLHKKAPKP